MKKVVTLIIGGLTTLASVAQVSIGVQGTGTLSDANIETTDFFVPSKKMRTLPGAGVVVDINLKPSLVLRTGVNYQQQGITLEASANGVPGEIEEIKTVAKLNLHYVQVPLNVLYETKGATRFFVGGGPYVSFAVSGKSKNGNNIQIC